LDLSIFSRRGCYRFARENSHDVNAHGFPEADFWTAWLSVVQLADCPKSAFGRYTHARATRPRRYKPMEGCRSALGVAPRNHQADVCAGHGEDKLRDEVSLYSAAQEFAQVATEILTETIDAKGGLQHPA